MIGRQVPWVVASVDVTAARLWSQASEETAFPRAEIEVDDPHGTLAVAGGVTTGAVESTMVMT